MSPYAKTKWSGNPVVGECGSGLKPNVLTWRSRETSHLGQCDNNELRKPAKPAGSPNGNLTVTIV